MWAQNALENKRELATATPSYIYYAIWHDIILPNVDLERPFFFICKQTHVLVQWVSTLFLNLEEKNTENFKFIIIFE